jgi:Choline dehydrogenase and related flavoproteins
MCADRIQNPDVVIVGSGISGALIAKVLATGGRKVLILEAGEELPPNINGYMDRFLNATAKVPESPYPPEIFNAKGDLTDPATVNAGRPTVLSLGPKGSTFNDFSNPKMSYLVQNGPLAFGSTYERINGGTSRHWLGTSLRFVPADFEMKSRYGRFVDWPIKYADLEKWYGEAEKEIGISANVADQGYLDIGFSPGYSYPTAAHRDVEGRHDGAGGDAGSEDRRRRPRRPRLDRLQHAGGAQFPTLPEPPGLRRQHQLHSDLSDPGQV